MLTVHGGDRPGIVSAVAREVAAVDGNITDLSTRLAGELYLLVAEIDLPPAVDAEALGASIRGRRRPSSASPPRCVPPTPTSCEPARWTP